jgi:hypothetical protein
MQEKRGRKRGDRRGERVQGQSMMDVARQAFVRDVALDRWRDIQDLRDTVGLDWARAAQEAGQFLGRGAYSGLWVRQWREAVLPAAAAGNPAEVFAAVERAIVSALAAEEEERRLRRDRPIEEDREFKAFVDRIVESLLRQQAAELGAP